MNISFHAPLSPDANAFLSAQTGVDYSAQDMRHWFCATAYNDADEIVAALACEPKTWFDWHFNCAVADPRAMSRRLLKTIFKTLFRHAVRVTAEIDPMNEQAVRSARRMGFVYEGFKRLGIEGNRDALLFGMLAQDCRYLPGFDPANTSIVSPGARRVILPSAGGHHGVHPQAS